MTTRKKLFPGWLIVAGGFLIMATCYTTFVNCLSLFLVPITTDLGITRVQFNTNSSIAAVVGVVASLLVGKLVDKYNARIIGIIDILLIVADIVLWSFVKQLWQMYVLSMLTGFCVIAGTRLLISILVANWFDKKRGLAVSIALSGSGVGGVVLSQLAAHLIQTQGWRTAFLILAAITLVCSLPLTATVFRNRPSDIGLQPYGEGETDTGKGHAQNGPLVDIDGKTATKSAAFWMLALGFLFMGLVNGAVIMNIAANFTDAGHTAAFAATIVSTQMFVLIVAKITIGAVYDRFGTLAGTLLGGITTVLATIALLFSSSTVAPYLFALFFGFGTCLGTVAPPLMVIHEFGKKNSGSLTGYVTAIEMLGVAIGAPAMGAFYDKAGSYTQGWVLMTVIGILMTVTLTASIGMAKKLAARLTQAA